MRNSFTHFVVPKMSIIFRGSVATYARYGKMFNDHFIANFLGKVLVKKN